jgi:hypothetical protein
MYISPRASEHSYDFCKPATEAALAVFDPDLQLVWNGKHECFQVMRERSLERSYYLEGFGWLTSVEPVHVHVTDWKEGIMGSDNPAPLLQRLWESDTHRFTVQELMDRYRGRAEAHRLRSEATVSDNYRHAFQDNERLLLSAMEPIHNFPGFVR